MTRTFRILLALDQLLGNIIFENISLTSPSAPIAGDAATPGV